MVSYGIYNTRDDEKPSTLCAVPSEQPVKKEIYGRRIKVVEEECEEVDIKDIKPIAVPQNTVSTTSQPVNQVEVPTATLSSSSLGDEGETSGTNIRQNEATSTPPLPRKRFARFREKKFVCDVCDTSFTLKQSAAVHLFLYHVQPDGTMKPAPKKKGYQCKSCERMDNPLSAPQGVFSLMLQRMMMEAQGVAASTMSSQPPPRYQLSSSSPHHACTAPPLRARPALCELTAQPSAEHMRARKRMNLERTVTNLMSRAQQRMGTPDADVPATTTHASANPTEKSVPEIKKEDTSDEDVDVVGGTETEPTDLSLLNGQVAEIFRTPNAVEVHQKKAHKKSTPKVPSDCEECGKTFASAFQLREHVVIQHLKERNFKCEQCDQKFGRRGGLRRHVQMVHQNHLHKCPYENCEHPGYKCSKALTAHIRSVHTNVRPFVCGECSKAFVRKNDLKMHQLTHSKELQFECECGVKFRRQMYLRKHQKNCEAARTQQASSPSDSLGDDGSLKEETDEMVNAV